MANIKIQYSKEMLCDYLLAKLWQHFLSINHYNINQDYDLIIKRPDYVKGFINFIKNITESSDDNLTKFNLSTTENMTKQLTQVYKNLVNNNFDFQKEAD